MKHFIQPDWLLTIGSTNYQNNTMISADITRLENGFDSATFTLSNTPELYPTPITNNATVSFAIKDATKEVNRTTIFSGVINFPKYNTGQQSIIMVKARGAGYPLEDMQVIEEYGAESRNSATNTFTEIATAIIDSWVNKNLGSANDSGHSISTTNIDTISDSLNYIVFPSKPANKCLDDLCDLETAKKAGSAGPHWIVDTSGNLRIKLIGNSQTGWTKYYGDSQANATLTDKDFWESSFEPFGKEGNQILYFGMWRRPSSGDTWTENNSGLWGENGYSNLTDDTSTKIVGSYSLKSTPNGGDATFYYPSAKNAAWDFSFSEFQTPSLNLWVQRVNPGFLSSISIYLMHDDSNYLTHTWDTLASGVWYHIQLPIGPFYKSIHTSHSWTIETGTMDWSSVNWIEIKDPGGQLFIDGLHFSGVPVCRVAREKYPSESGTLGQSTNLIKTLRAVDNIGKDDSLKASDDSGVLAQMAYSALLKAQKTGINGTIKISLLPDLLPGQYLYYDSKDWRVTKIIHHIENSQSGCYTLIDLTDDLTNSHARSTYEDLNKLYADIRPEFQDREATSLSSGDIDVRLLRLEKAY
jgi:hypothetical protein